MFQRTHEKTNSAFFDCEVLEVRHYTDTLFSFRTARPQSFRFRTGEFVMIGLAGEGKPTLRAYSLAGPSWDDALEFYSIKVEDGALTSRLKHIRPGDRVLVGRKPTGTLVLDALLPGKRLFLLSTGTGIAPFASIVREPDVYARHDQVILTHTCRTAAELTYSRELVAGLKDDPLVGDSAPEQLVYFSSVTREDGPQTGRITDLIQSGLFFKSTQQARFDPEHDRVMICGSLAMLEELKALFEGLGFTEGSNARPGSFVVEKAFSGDGI
ncbi:MAG: ferredoxin--NADP reductase [Oceanicaulis sp.]|uniref:ferredoxin--NADP reductase n=1 Tax=Glycocaulis sp. TaxID=1969725 RepID=UPI0025C0B0E9|nr:ferredoxin--NADP reductase [Glycocaulis sp.]MCC5982594.1 ferredoxin--NADP reductase [Oceanicaulis sp.]MCH8522411.1 ferredoxin--NADP reductase [Glycocaulis sp.]